VRALPAVLLACLLTTAGISQQSGPSVSSQATVTLTYDNPNLAPNHYTLMIRENGSGEYASSDGTSKSPAAGKAKDYHQEVSITQPLLGQIFATARANKYFAIQCEMAKGDRVAFQGHKTLSYEGADGKGSCTYNYSQNKQIQKLGEDLQSVSSTLEAGYRLAMEHQHDRLSLDAELGWLQQSVKDGRAIELQNIHTVLEEIAADPGVLNRARQRATALAQWKPR
jgi:hypothetical protein